jgi:hypothetical protein
MKNLKKNEKNVSINNSKIMNTTLNNNSSFISQASRKLDKNASKSRLKTGGNENTSSKVFNKMLENKDSIKNNNNSKDNTNTLKKINRSPSIGKIVTDNILSKINTGLTEEFKRKSLIKSQEKKKESANKSINLTMTQTVINGDKKKQNFISRKSLVFSKPKVNKDDDNKLSKAAIMGKILDTRKIKGDDRDKNLLTEVIIEVANTQQNLQVNRKQLRNKNSKIFQKNSRASLNVDEFGFKRRNTVIPIPGKIN